MTDVPTLAAARRLLAAGDLSPTGLLDACAARIAASEPTLRAWITLDLEGAREQVRRLDPADREVLPLWGVPVAVKDIIDVAGLPTTAASRILAGNVAAADAPAVARLRAAGAVILGKTNTQEF
ncbi:MAG: amidase family protein, partial [Actinomycetota bacterium]